MARIGARESARYAGRKLPLYSDVAKIVAKVSEEVLGSLKTSDIGDADALRLQQCILVASQVWLLPRAQECMVVVSQVLMTPIRGKPWETLQLTDLQTNSMRDQQLERNYQSAFINMQMC
jgi:hypothetical protein